LTVGEREAPERIGLVDLVVIENVDATIANGGAGVTFAEINSPEFFPLSSKWRGTGGDVVAIRSAKFWPCTGNFRRYAVAGGKFPFGKWRNTFDGVGLSVAIHAGLTLWKLRLIGMASVE